MPQPSEPKPVKTCPLCQVAMRATFKETDTVYHCERCQVSMTIGPAKPKDCK